MRKLVNAVMASLFLSFVGYAQAGDKVNWKAPDMYLAGQITFTTPDLTMECDNCKCMEIRTQKGLTGIYIQAGVGHFDIKKNKLKDVFSDCLIRFNPKDSGAFLSIRAKYKITDKKFHGDAMKQVNKVFPHCYHIAYNALYPDVGDYALNFSCAKYDDFLASFTKNKNIFFNYTRKLYYE